MNKIELTNEELKKVNGGAGETSPVDDVEKGKLYQKYIDTNYYAYVINVIGSREVNITFKSGVMNKDGKVHKTGGLPQTKTYEEFKSNYNVAISLDGDAYWVK